MSSSIDLVGRDALLDELWQLLRPEASAARKTVVLHGPAGIGKADLALQFSGMHEDPDEGGFSAAVILDARSENSLQYGLAHSLWKYTDLGGLQTVDRTRDAEEALHWLDAPENNRWLIVVENFDRGLLGCDISSYLPFANHGSVIITSRDPQPNLGHCVEVGKLTSDDAVKLLARRAGIDIESSADDSANRPDLLHIAEELDGVPQSLIISGSYIAQTGVSPAECLDRYLALQHGLPSGDPLATAVALSYNEMERKAPLSAKLLLLLSCYYSRTIWSSLIRVALDEENEKSWLFDVASTKEAFNRALQPLLDHALVGVRPGTAIYFMHLSVQDLLKRSMGKDDRKELMSIVVKSIGYKASQLAARNGGGHGLEHILLRQAECVYDDIERDIEAWDSSRLGGAFCGLGDLFFDAGRLAKAELMFSLAQTHSLRDNGPDHPITLDAVCALGRVYGRKRRYKESEDLLLDALAGYTKLVGPEHPSTLKVQDSLGAVYRRQDRDKEAEDKFRQALSGYTRVLGPYHSDTLLSIENIVRFYAQRNRIDDARRIYEQHLADCKTAFGTEYATVVDRIHHLITLYRDPNRQTEGEALRTEIDNAVQNVAEDHCITYQTIANVGLLYLVQDKFKEAEDALWEAVLGNEIFCSMDDPLTLKHMTNLAVVHVRAGHVARGEFTLRKVLDLQDESGVRDDELRERVLGYLQRIQARHPAVAAEEIPLESQGLRPGYVRSRL